MREIVYLPRPRGRHLLALQRVGADQDPLAVGVSDIQRLVHRARARGVEDANGAFLRGLVARPARVRLGKVPWQSHAQQPHDRTRRYGVNAQWCACGWLQRVRSRHATGKASGVVRDAGWGSRWRRGGDQAGRRVGRLHTLVHAAPPACRTSYSPPPGTDTSWPWEPTRRARQESRAVGMTRYRISSLFISNQRFLDLASLVGALATVRARSAARGDKETTRVSDQRAMQPQGCETLAPKHARALRPAKVRNIIRLRGGREEAPRQGGALWLGAGDFGECGCCCRGITSARCARNEAGAGEGSREVDRKRAPRNAWLALPSS